MIIAKEIDSMEQELDILGSGQTDPLLSMHLEEIEEEAHIILEMLKLSRVQARSGAVEAGQESLAELTVALEHLLHHGRNALPALHKMLDLEPAA